MIEPPRPSRHGSVLEWCQRLWEFVRATRVRVGPGLESEETASGTLISLRKQPAGTGAEGCTTLRVALGQVEGSWKVTVSPGFIESAVPKIGADFLTADPAPTLTVGGETKLWLVIEWEPGSDSEDGVHWITSGGTLVSAEFVLGTSRPSETAPEVDEEGAVTNGVFAFLWADIVAAGEGYRIAAARCGTRQLTFCPPASLKLLNG